MLLPRMIFCCCLLTGSIELYSQVTTIYYDRARNFYVDVYKENEIETGNCSRPVTYHIKTRGVSPANIILTWTFTYYDCNSKEVHYPVEIRIWAGQGNYHTTKTQRMVKMKTVIDGDARPEFITPPADFYITGDTLIMEDDSTTLRAGLNTYVPGVRWLWYKKGAAKNFAEGSSVSVRPAASTTYQVKSELKGFSSRARDFYVRVKMKPDPPKIFDIRGTRNILEGDTVSLSVINVRDPVAGAQWLWYRNNETQPFDRGQTIDINPFVTTRYRLQSELNGKRSLFKYFDVDVTKVDEPPSDFTITGKRRVTEGEENVLRVNSSQNAEKVRWLWYRTGEPQSIGEGDTIVVTPAATTTYQVVAVNHKKRSTPRSFIVNVYLTPKTPDVTGNMKVCAIAGSRYRYAVSGGRLGSDSKAWQWYEGTCGSGKLVATGNTVEITAPAQTTTYFVRPDADASVCRQFTIEVIPATVLPSGISAPPTVCHDDPFQLTIVGGQLSENARWVWYAREVGQSNTNEVGEGNSIVASAASQSEFLVRSEGGTCPSSNTTSVRVNVITRPVSSGYISTLRVKRNRYQLTAINLPAAGNYSVNWYDKGCQTGKISSTQSIEYKVGRKGSDVYMQLTGDCDTLDCISVHLDYEQRVKEKYFFMNFGAVDKDFSGIQNGMITIGGRVLYLRAKLYLRDLQGVFDGDYTAYKPQYNTDGATVFDYPSNNTYYRLSGKDENKRTSYTLGVLFGFRHARMYVGAGYGKLEQLHEVNIYQRNSNVFLEKTWAKDINVSVSGPEGEAGLFFKFGGFNIMGGASIIYSPSEKRKYVDAHAGIGFSF